MNTNNPKRRTPWLEVFPVKQLTLGYADGSEGEELAYYARLRSSNGAKLMTTEAYDSDSNAIRAAKAINTSACLGRLQIRILDADGKVRRTIEPRA